MLSPSNGCGIAWLLKYVMHQIILRAAGPIFDQSAAYEMLTFLGPDVVEGYTALRVELAPDFAEVERAPESFPPEPLEEMWQVEPPDFLRRILKTAPAVRAPISMSSAISDTI